MYLYLVSQSAYAMHLRSISSPFFCCRPCSDVSGRAPDPVFLSMDGVEPRAWTKQPGEARGGEEMREGGKRGGTIRGKRKKRNGEKRRGNQKWKRKDKLISMERGEARMERNKGRDEPVASTALHCLILHSMKWCLGEDMQRRRQPDGHWRWNRGTQDRQRILPTVFSASELAVAIQLYR